MPENSVEKQRQREFSEAQRQAILREQAGLTLPSIPGAAAYPFESPAAAEQYLYPEPEKIPVEEDFEEEDEFDESDNVDIEGQPELRDESLADVAGAGREEAIETELMRQDESMELEWMRRIQQQQKKQLAARASQGSENAVEEGVATISGTFNAILRLNPLNPKNQNMVGMLGALLRLIVASIGGGEILQTIQNMVEHGDKKSPKLPPAFPGDTTEAQFDYLLILLAALILFAILIVVVSIMAFFFNFFSMI